MVTAVFGGLAVLVTPVRAQQQQQQPPDQQGQGQQPSPDTNAPENTPEQPTEPVPAIRSPLAGATDNQGQQESQQIVPDTTPLTGAENITSGKALMTHNYWAPKLNIFSTADSDGLAEAGSGKTGWLATTSILAGVDLHDASSRSTLDLQYLGGGTFATNSAVGNSVIQNFGLTEKLSWQRVQLTFTDQFAYIPETSFGYNGFTGVPLPGGGSTGLQQGLTPGDSILTAVGQRITNSFITELDTQISRRTTLTFLGGYTLLHYFDNDLLNFSDAIFQAGYNYQWTRKDTIAVLYRFNGYRYSNFDQSINDNLFQVSYGRRVTGKFSFQIAAGPEYATFALPISNSTTGTGTSTPTGESKLLWSLSTNATYTVQRSNIQASYMHGVTGGSGVLAGSIGDTVTVSANHQFTRGLNGGVNFG
jgi:hypothetical protein